VPDGYGGYRDARFTAQAKEEDVAKTARDVMTGDCECVGEDDTVLDAAND
jgi:hypothetical protein